MKKMTKILRSHISAAASTETDIISADLNKSLQQITPVCSVMLKTEQGIHHNPKTILRVMQKYNLLSVVTRKRYHKYVNIFIDMIIFSIATSMLTDLIKNGLRIYQNGTRFSFLPLFQLFSQAFRLINKILKSLSYIAEKTVF